MAGRYREGLGSVGAGAEDCANTRRALSTEEAVPEVSSVSPTLVETPPPVPWLEATTIQQLPGTPAPQPLLPGIARPVPCGPHEAMCHDGQCVPKDYICDGQEDCKNGSDELNCGEDPGCGSRGAGGGAGPLAEPGLVPQVPPRHASPMSSPVGTGTAP